MEEGTALFTNYPLWYRRVYLHLPESIRTKIKEQLLPLVRGRVVYEASTAYNHIQVIDKGHLRYLIFLDDGQCPNVQFPEQFYQSYMARNPAVEKYPPYALYAHLGYLFNPDLRQVLMIGLGGGVIPKQFLAAYPDLALFKVIEIDPAVVKVARDYFQLPQDNRLSIIIGDGRQNLQTEPPGYDLIMIDAFSTKHIPAHLITREFFETARAKLTAGGIVLINVFGALSGDNCVGFKRIYLTLSKVFAYLSVFPDKQSQPARLQNIILVAGNQPALNKAALLERVKGLSRMPWYRKLQGLAGNLYDGGIALEDVRPFLDGDAGYC